MLAIASTCPIWCTSCNCKCQGNSGTTNSDSLVKLRNFIHRTESANSTNKKIYNTCRMSTTEMNCSHCYNCYSHGALRYHWPSAMLIEDVLRTESSGLSLALELLCNEWRPHCSRLGCKSGFRPLLEITEFALPSTYCRSYSLQEALRALLTYNDDKSLEFAATLRSFAQRCLRFVTTLPFWGCSKDGANRRGLIEEATTVKALF